MGDLTVRILEASNLMPADRNGKADPYVTVEILEAPLQKKQKTSVHKKVLKLLLNQSLLNNFQRHSFLYGMKHSI